MGGIQSSKLYTGEIKGDDVLPEEAQSKLSHNQSMMKENITFHVRLQDVHMRQLKIKEKGYINFTVFDQGGQIIYTGQTRSTNNDEKDPKFDITGEFEHTLVIEDLKKHHLKISLIPLEDDHAGEPLSIISIDFIALAFGPTHHAVKFMTNGGRHGIALLQYNIHFEQVGMAGISLKKLDIKFNSIEESPIGSNFRIITPDEKLESSWSHSKIGKYDTKDHITTIGFNYIKRPSSKIPVISFLSKMEDIMNSSIQICIWKDNRTITEKEKLRTIITKNQSTGVNVDDVGISIEADYKSESSESEYNSALDSEHDHSAASETPDETPDEGELSYDDETPNSSEETMSVDSSNRNVIQNHRHQLIGEGHIGFSRIIKSFVEYINRGNVDFTVGKNGSLMIGESQTNQATIDIKDLAENKWQIHNHRIWFYGRHVGDISLMIEAKNMPFVRQMIVGVLTSKGVTLSSTPWPDTSSNKASRKDLPPQMIHILNNFSEMKKRDLLKHGNKKVPLSKVKKGVANVVEKLKETEKKSMICFVYKSAASGIRSQEIFIEVALHGLRFVDFIDQDIKSQYFEILNLVLHRGELDLDQVSLTKAQSDGLSSNLISSKEKLSLKYQYLLYESLNFCIDKLKRKAVDFYRRDFIVSNIAISYFKIPEFRVAFLKAMNSVPVPNIPEWRSTNVNMNNDESNEQGGDDKFTDNFFNWEKNFYSKIPNDGDIKGKNLEILKRIIKDDKWEEKISKRGVALFLIVSKWAEYVKTTIVNNKVEWWGIPGYKKILKVIVHQIKERKITEYPDSLIEGSCSLMANENIMYVLIDIIFKKTNIHIPAEVNGTMDIIEKWFHVISNDGKVFPANFDYNFFNKGIEMLIDYEHAITTPKALWLIYKIFHIFPLHQQLTLSTILFEKRFCQLFYNWSWNIRNVYHKLFLYQLFHVYGKGAVDNKENTDRRSPIKKVKSSNNLRFVKIDLISKALSGNATTTIAHTLMKNENDIIKKIMKIAVQRKSQIGALIDEVDSNAEFDFKDYESAYQDSDDESEPKESDDTLSIKYLIKQVPDLYKPYIGKAIDDYVKEKQDYDIWDKYDDDNSELPEILLQAVMDETENPAPVDGSDW